MLLVLIYISLDHSLILVTFCTNITINQVTVKQEILDRVIVNLSLETEPDSNLTVKNLVCTIQGTSWESKPQEPQVTRIKQGYSDIIQKAISEKRTLR